MNSIHFDQILLLVILGGGIVLLLIRYRKKYSKNIRKLLIQKIHEQRKTIRFEGQRVSTVLENLPVILFIINKEGQFTLVEGKGLEELGFQQKDTVGKSIFDVQEQIPELTVGFDKALKGEAYNTIVHVQNMFFETKYNSYKNDKGQINGVIGVAIDITDKVKTEQYLRNNQQTQDLILQSLPIMLYAAQATGDFGGTWITDNVKNITGFGAENFIKDPFFWSSLLHPEDKERVLKEYVSIPQKGKAELEYRWQCADGNYRWFRDYAVLAKHQTGTGAEIIGIWEDITERRKLEDEIKVSDTKYKTLVDRMNEGLIYVDENNHIKFVNDRLCMITGYSRQELIGKSVYRFLLHEEDQNLIKTKTELRQKGISDEYEVEMKKKSGEKINIKISASPIMDEKGKLIGSMGVFSDITQQKKMETNLKAKIKELDTFMYKASHDLRGPLSSMMGLVNVARQEIMDNDSLGYLDLIARSASRLDSILLDLLQITRIAQGEIQIVPIHFDSLIQDIRKSLAYLPDVEEVKFKVNIDVPDEYKSDKRLLLSILQNLIDNAVKYRRRNSNSFIFINIISISTGVKITVEDNGIGIPKDLQEKVFDMFFRATLTSTGSGLGLYIVKNAVEKLGGNVELKSEEGLGSAITILLPKK